MMFKKNHKIIYSAALISIICIGCSGNPESNSATSNSRNQSTAVLNNNAASTPAMTNSSTPAASNNPSANANRNVKPAPAANQPAPKIGSGGDDLALFAQVRSALSADPELFNGVIVEIREGNATLTGKVASEEKKKKAEQLVQNISAIKSVKNNVRVAP